MHKPTLLFLLLGTLTASTCCIAQNTTVASPTSSASKPTSDFIRIDQFGYLPQSQKVAVIVNPQVGWDADAKLSFAPSTGANQYQLRRWDNNAVVLAGTLTAWNRGATDELSGDKAWWFDFSSVTTPGSYYVYDVGNKVGSFRFEIGNDVYADELRAALRMFYYQRCGYPKLAEFAGANWVDTASYVGPNQDTQARSVLEPDNPATAKDLSGGWYDAGDLNKYSYNNSNCLNHLLDAYEQNPSVFGDNNRIPESGNGIPDILDEVKWELDWLKKMQLEDGSVLHKMGLLRSIPDKREYLPPGRDPRPRYYYPATSSATFTLAHVFAHAYLVYKDVPGMKEYADDLKSRAVRAFTHFRTHPFVLNTRADIQGGNGDWSIEKQKRFAVGAAVYMYAATGDASYKAYVEDNLVLLAEDMRLWRPYETQLTQALLYYSTLPGVTPAVARRIRESKIKAAQTDKDVYKWDERDPYRSYMARVTFHWGHLSGRSSVGFVNYDMIQYGLDPANAALYRQRGEEALHYINGVNPFNMVYLTNMYVYGAEKSADEIFHNWFSDGSDWDNVRTSAKGGPPPGYLPGGPDKNWKPYAGTTEAEQETAATLIETLRPPYGQPPQKAYRNWNKGWPDKSYTVTEPSIEYQGGFIKLLSKFATKATTPMPLPPEGPWR